MSELDYILDLLKIKDKNIRILDNIGELSIRGVNYTLLKGVLSYDVHVCPCCKKAHTVIKYGFKMSRIKLLPVAGHPVLLELKKQKFFCKECHKSFLASTSLVDRNCFISRSVKHHIFTDLTLKVSEKDIAKLNFVSASTVSRFVDNSYSDFKADFNHLPDYLCFDEFKSTKRAKGSMSFIFCDARSHRVIDIVENRQLPFLERYFKKFSREARESVKGICTDIYSPYISLIKSYFPNARVILDRFHIVQLISRALNRIRINAMKNFSSYSMEYKALKKYWKLILASEDKLDAREYVHFTHFRGRTNMYRLVKTITGYDEGLRVAYEYFQMLYYCIRMRDVDNLKRVLCSVPDKLDDIMKTAVNTLIENLEHVISALESPFSNGPIEGINNFIKTFKKVAFGYRSFFHFRNRILIALKLIYPIDKYEKRRTSYSP